MHKHWSHLCGPVLSVLQGSAGVRSFPTKRASFREKGSSAGADLQPSYNRHRKAPCLAMKSQATGYTGLCLQDDYFAGRELQWASSSVSGSVGQHKSTGCEPADLGVLSRRSDWRDTGLAARAVLTAACAYRHACGASYGEIPIAPTIETLQKPTGYLHPAVIASFQEEDECSLVKEGSGHRQSEQ
jgi:hypothetical protein